MAELEKIVAEMERGNRTLDDTLSLFERGRELVSVCDRRLADIKQRVEKVVRTRNNAVEEARFE